MLRIRRCCPFVVRRTGERFLSVPTVRLWVWESRRRKGWHRWRCWPNWLSATGPRRPHPARRLELAVSGRGCIRGDRGAALWSRWSTGGGEGGRGGGEKPRPDEGDRGRGAGGGGDRGVGRFRVRASPPIAGRRSSADARIAVLHDRVPSAAGEQDGRVDSCWRGIGAVRPRMYCDGLGDTAWAGQAARCATWQLFWVRVGCVRAKLVVAKAMPSSPRTLLVGLETGAGLDQRRQLIRGRWWGSGSRAGGDRDAWVWGGQTYSPPNQATRVSMSGPQCVGAQPRWG